MGEYVMGLDAGADRSDLAIFTTEGNLVDFRRREPLNHEIISGSFSQLERGLIQIMREVTKDRNFKIGEVAYAVFGTAGIDTPERRAAVTDIVKRIGIKKFIICNEAYLGISSVCPEYAGICAVNGAGCTVAGMDFSGKMLQIGGAGALSYDLGGNGKMAEIAIGSVYKSSFRGGEETLLTKLLFDRLEIQDKYSMINVISKMQADGMLDLPILDSLIFEAAGMGDKVAMRLLQDVGDNYYSGIAYILNELDFPKNKPVHIALTGSIFEKPENAILIYAIKRNLAKGFADRKFIFKQLEKPLVMGAVLWAYRRLGIDGMVGKVYSQF